MALVAASIAWPRCCRVARACARVFVRVFVRVAMRVCACVRACVHGREGLSSGPMTRAILFRGTCGGSLDSECTIKVETERCGPSGTSGTSGTTSGTTSGISGTSAMDSGKIFQYAFGY